MKRRFVFSGGERAGQHAYYGSGDKANRLALDEAFTEIPAEKMPPDSDTSKPVWTGSEWEIPPPPQEQIDDRDVKKNLWRWRNIMTSRALGDQLSAEDLAFLEKAKRVFGRRSKL